MLSEKVNVSTVRSALENLDGDEEVLVPSFKEDSEKMDFLVSTEMESELGVSCVADRILIAAGIHAEVTEASVVESSDAVNVAVQVMLI